MRRFGTTLVSLLLVSGVLVSGDVHPFNLRTQVNDTLVSAASVVGSSDSTYQAKLFSRRAKRNRDHIRADQERSTKFADADTDDDRDRARPRRSLSHESGCGNLTIVDLPAGDVCTHGPDPAPPGLEINDPVRRLSVGMASQEMAGIACDGDGQSGYRVQVLYVRAADVSSRYTQYLDSIRGWAGEADQIFQASAAETDGSRNLRFVQGTDCRPLVPEVVVSPVGDGSFNATIDDLRSLGFNRTDRIYLAFVDTTGAKICGVGTLWPDDRPGSANKNNLGPSYSRVDAGCWRGDIAAHELMHNLGGVQNSAPNASGWFHCIDEYDIMCYRDSNTTPPMRVDCTVPSLNTTRFDCGHDDYFHTNPTPGSYLATFWNAANNRFLVSDSTGSEEVVPPPPLANDSPLSSVADKKDKRKGKHTKKGKGGRNKQGKGGHTMKRR
jgi:hypothetical protein